MGVEYETVFCRFRCAFFAGGRLVHLRDHRGHEADVPEERQFMAIAVDWCIENNMIVEGATTYLVGGRMVALHGHKCACDAR